MQKVKHFVTESAEQLAQFSEMKDGNHRDLCAMEERQVAMESLVLHWECTSIANMAESIFPTTLVQNSRRVEWAAMQKAIADANDDIRVTCTGDASAQLTKPTVRARVVGWRTKRTDAICSAEQILAQELQYCTSNASQRQVLRARLALMRELMGLLARMHIPLSVLQRSASHTSDTPFLTYSVPPKRAEPTSTALGANRVDLQITGEKRRSSVSTYTHRRDASPSSGNLLAAPGPSSSSLPSNGGVSVAQLRRKAQRQQPGQQDVTPATTVPGTPEEVLLTTGERQPQLQSALPVQRELPVCGNEACLRASVTSPSSSEESTLLDAILNTGQ